MADAILKGKTSRKIQHLASYICSGQRYDILRCKPKDIPDHSDLVSQFWEDPSMQTMYMGIAIKNNSAFKLVDTSGNTLCYLYGIPQDRHILCATSFWCKLKKYAVIGYQFIRDHTFYERIYWSPHKFDGRIPLAYVLEDRMITDYKNGRDFVEITVPNKKFEKMLRIKSRIYHIREVFGGR